MERYVILLAIILCFACWAQLVRKLLCLIWNSRREIAFLSLTPPSSLNQTPYATQQLFSILHQQLARRSLANELLGNKASISLEIISSRNKGIHYVVGVDSARVTQTKATLLSYLPELRIATTSDPLSSVTSSQTALQEFAQSKHFAFPLKAQDDAADYDPLKYMLGAITKPLSSETLIFQLVATPIEIKKLPELSSSIQDDTLKKRIRTKFSEQLFATSIRTIAIDSDSPNKKKRSAMMTSALNSYSYPRYQKLQPRHRSPITKHYGFFMTRSRLISNFFTKPCIFSAAEVGSLYHFTQNVNTNQEDVVYERSKNLPLPLSQKRTQDFDIEIGKNDYHGIESRIGLTAKEREKHLFILGGTGNGKTTLIMNSVVQDIEKGKGVGVVDPHGDLAEEVLTRIPDERIKDVIYFNPDDIAYPIGINLLEIPEGLDEESLIKYKDQVTESTIDVLRKLFSQDDSGGHRIEYILRNAIQTALTIKDATLFTVYALLNNPTYRREIIGKLDDESLKDFWFNEFIKAGEFQRVKMAAGVTAKIGRFLFSAQAKRILEQPKSTINFDELLSSEKILICNLSKGRLGNDTSELLGTMVLAKLQAAVLRRASESQQNRKPFYLYVDEFQNFAVMSFVQLLSEARKYKFYITIAEQSTSQQENRSMVNIILANVGVLLCFRTGDPYDENLVLPFFTPQLEKGDLMNLNSFHFYARILAQKSQQPISGITVRLQTSIYAHNLHAVVEYSRLTYATKYVTPPKKPRSRGLIRTPSVRRYKVKRL